MHRFPKLFNSHNNKSKQQMESKSQPTTPNRPKPRPKLDRRNAAKNIDYDSSHSNFFTSSSASTSSYSPDDSFAIRTRSIDVYPWGDRTSFRINGKEEGELEFICKSLGLNGPDDFGISADDYRVMKARGGQFSGQVSNFVDVQLQETHGGLVDSTGTNVILCVDRSPTADVNASVGVKLCDGGLGNGELSGQVSRFVDLSAGEVGVLLGVDRSRSDGVNASVDDYRVMKARYGELSSQVSTFVNVGGVEVQGDDGVLVDSRLSSVTSGLHRSRGGGANNSVDDVPGQVSTFVNINSVEVEGDNGVLVDSRVSSVILGIDQSRGDGINDSVGVKLCDGVLENGELYRGVVEDVVSGLSEREGGKMVLRGERSGVGIKGERPPAVLLTPPPWMVLPVIDDAGSSWDILRSFGPGNDSISRIDDDQGESSSGDERHRSAQVIEGDDDGVTRETIVGQGSGLISDSCSFTSNSNDDSSSTTTESMSISPNGRLIRPISSWEKGKHLGSGSYGSVYEGYADGGFFFAVKEVSLVDQGVRGRDIIYQFEQEMAFLSQFEHKNIVRYLGTDKDDSNLYIFLELLPQGSLLSLYQRLRLQDSQVSVYTRQILEGLKYLHERNVVHRDIKCANILLGVNGNVKLADFGLAKVDKLNDAKSCKGTSYWMAPEVVMPNQRYGRAADIWSLGCTVLEMLTKKFPYHPLDGFQAMFRIGSGQPPPIPDFLSRDARDFILNCLQVNPDTRPSAAELLEHPFVKEVTNL